jgi:hypothetical protein
MGMTRAEVKAQYDVNQHGIITSPGKFESTPIYTPHFWELALEGDGDETYDVSICKYVSIMKVEPWDRAEYPELTADDVDLLQIYEDDQGFVHIDVLDAQNQDKEHTNESSEGGQDGID